MYTMKVLIVICIFIISLLKKYSAVGPGDPIEIVHDMHPNDKVLVSSFKVYHLLFSMYCIYEIST